MRAQFYMSVNIDKVNRLLSYVLTVLKTFLIFFLVFTEPRNKP